MATKKTLQEVIKGFEEDPELTIIEFKPIEKVREELKKAGIDTSRIKAKFRKRLNDMRCLDDPEE